MIDPINGTTATVHEPGYSHTYTQHTYSTYIHTFNIGVGQVMVVSQGRSTTRNGRRTLAACGKGARAVSSEQAVCMYVCMCI
jgi:hypothetical protein